MSGNNDPHELSFMRAPIFISGSVLVGFLFALHDSFAMKHMGYSMRVATVFAAWGAQFFLLGSMCWLLWRFGRDLVDRAKLSSILLVFLPLSIAIGLVEELIWVLLFPNLPSDRPHMSYWNRLAHSLYSDLFQDMIAFWFAFLLFRGLGYYQRYREKEQAASQLQVELANAQLSALRMQMNPHFLFNTMNSISSLMRINVDAADKMLEQLSSLMRITLERGDAQLVTLRDELDCVELFLEMQAHRYADRVAQSVDVDPELYDALVPAMLLQPVIENAYVHGISKLQSHGEISLEIKRDHSQIKICVENSGLGLRPGQQQKAAGHGVGLANIQSRLTLHYGNQASLTMTEPKAGRVRVTIFLPLQFSQEPEMSSARYSVQ